MSDKIVIGCDGLICVAWTKGLHWSMQPGAYGRVTLYSDPQHIAEKYAYYQKRFSGTGPAIVHVVVTIPEEATTRILSSGALVRGRIPGKFYMCVNLYDVVYFDQQQQHLAYTATVYTV